MTTAAEKRAEAEAKAAEQDAAAAADAKSAKAEEETPVEIVVLRPAQWDVDAVQFEYDGDTLSIPKSGYRVPKDLADEVVTAAAEAGFALTQEG